MTSYASLTMGLAGLLVAGGLLAACSPLGALNALFVSDDRQALTDIAYGPDPRQRLDLHRPDGPAVGQEWPVVVFFYGGSWTSGERGDYRFVGDALAEHGIVAVIPDYRLHPDVRFPAFVEDGATVVAWAREHAAEHGGDPDRIFVAGHSAGAHIATLLALDGRYLEATGNDRGSLAGLIALAGPHAFDPLQYRSVRDVFAHLPDPDEARPIAFADGDAPRTLLLHGTGDTTVALWNSERLAQAIETMGGRVKLVTYDDIGHARLLLGFLRPLRARPPILDAIVAFVREAGS